MLGNSSYNFSFLVGLIKVMYRPILTRLQLHFKTFNKLTSTLNAYKKKPQHCRAYENSVDELHQAKTGKQAFAGSRFQDEQNDETKHGQTPVPEFCLRSEAP
jgi:hypothetical protein